jgi:hypothetical protein
MSRTNYPAIFLAALRGLGLKFDFHLLHGARTTRFDQTWRISYPAELDTVVGR